MSTTCPGCGAELSATFAYCPMCARPVPAGPTPRSDGPDRMDRWVHEMSDAAERMGRAAAGFSARAVDHADKALKDPPAAARAAIERARRELDRARKDLDELLR